MGDLLILAILAVLIGIGILFTVRHFQGKSSCCGTGEKIKTEEKKISHVIKTKTFIVEGMHCDHCKAWVEKAINSIDGVSAKVNFSKKEVVVSYEKEVSDKEIMNAVIKAGYKIKI